MSQRQQLERIMEIDRQIWDHHCANAIQFSQPDEFAERGLAMPCKRGNLYHRHPPFL